MQELNLKLLQVADLKRSVVLSRVLNSVNHSVTNLWSTRWPDLTKHNMVARKVNEWEKTSWFFKTVKEQNIPSRWFLGHLENSAEIWNPKFGRSLILAGSRFGAAFQYTPISNVRLMERWVCRV